MCWWRRDPSLFSRSRVHRYAQHVLRDHEAALRTRCFSRTPHKQAGHEGDDRGKRPLSMTNLEWMQLQHYDRWRKRLQEDPYKALFGASNDMLSGKGLKNWEWVHKTFPKWMLREMDLDGKPQEDRKATPSQTKYSEKYEIMGQHEHVPKAREPHFPEPSFRARQFERDESSGIISPSDLRRPREGSHVKVVGNAPSNGAVKENITSSALNTDGSTIFVPPTVAPASTSNTATVGLDHSYAAHITARSTKEEAAARESSFIDAFLANQSEHSSTAQEGPSSGWRQTALQRCAASGQIVKRRARSSLVPKTESDVTSSTTENVPKLSTEALEERSARSLQVKSKNVEWLIQQETPIAPKESIFQAGPTFAHSPSQVLSQLPEDDIDFISAADIRASMGAKRSRLPTDEQRQADRDNLEKAFAAARDIPHIDSMAVTEVINNQHVRRTERQMRDSQLAQEANKTQPTEGTTGQVPPAEAPMESSIDRMKRWLETTGASFAKQFWQDPTEEADVMKTRLFFDKAAHYLKKGQTAMRQITEDLEKDIPASKALLKRLKNDEEMLDLAIHQLRQRSSSGTTQGLSPRKIRVMESLKARFHQTNSELENAYAVLHALAGTDAVINATGSFKRKLTVASKVLHKNAQLLRMLIWSLQTRLEDSNMDRKILPNYKVVADNLLSLRDTQMTLMRLVDRAMLVYGVAPQSADGHKSNATKPTHTEFDNCDEPFVRARLAADAHLINEIKAQESAIQVPDDDKYTHAPKLSKSTTLDEPSPLAHSLFRPFGPAFEKLGTQEESDLAEEKAKEEKQRKLSDLKLVAEIEQAYEDTSGTIMVEHTKVKPEIEVKTSKPEKLKKFAMLKEDPEWVAELSDVKPVPTQDISTTPTIEDASTSPEVVEIVEAAKDASLATTTSSETGVSPTSGVEVPPTVISHGTPGAVTEGLTPTPVLASTKHLPTHYTILVRDPQTDSLSTTTSSTGPPRDTSPALPLHQALSALDSPAKFIPYITAGLEVVSANKDILVLRDSLDSTLATRPFETGSAHSHEISYAEGRTVNPIDGTTRLSPTGYVGPEESAEQLEKEFDERRQAAGKFNGREDSKDEKPMKERKRGGAGVVKTAIWVAGVCYVAGVVGEIASVS